MGKPIRRAKPARVKRSHGDGVSIDQYRAGYEMFRTGVHTVARLAAATKMTRDQVAWCVVQGDAANGMPSWISILDREVAAMQAKGIDVAQAVGEKGATLIKKQMDLVELAQNSLTILVNVYMHHWLIPGMKKLEAGEASPSDMSMPAEIRNTIKALKSLTDTKGIAATFQGIYESRWFTPTAPTNAIGKAAQVSLSPDAMLPASVALVEEGSSRDGYVDPVSTLLGVDSMNLDELKRFLESDQLPGESVDDLIEDSELEELLDVEECGDLDDES